MKLDNTDLRREFAISLNRLLDKHGLPASRHGRVQAFAEIIDRPISTAHRWIAGKGIPDIGDLFLLCDILSCSLDVLLGRIPTKREIIDIDQPKRATYFSENGNVDINIPSFFLPYEDSDRPLGILRVSGKEMSGFAEPNDRVLFDLNDTDIRSGAVFVLCISGTLTIRRLRIRLDGEIDVICDNKSYPAELFPKNKFIAVSEATAGDIPVFGRVIAKVNFEHR